MCRYVRLMDSCRQSAYPHSRVGVFCSSHQPHHPPLSRIDACANGPRVDGVHENSRQRTDHTTRTHYPLTPEPSSSRPQDVSISTLSRRPLWSMAEEEKPVSWSRLQDPHRHTKVLSSRVRIRSSAAYELVTGRAHWIWSWCGDFDWSYVMPRILRCSLDASSHRYESYMELATYMSC